MIKKIFIFALAPLLLAACSSENSNEPEQNPAGGQPGVTTDWELTTQLELSDNEKKAMNVVNDFSYRLMAEAQAASDNGSFCVSPLSMSIYLGMLANATTGDVHNEIMSALGTSNIDDLNSLNEKLMHYLPCDENGSSIGINNRFWVSGYYRVPEAFLDLSSKVFNAAVQYVDFSDSSTVPAINKWVYDTTNGLIPSLLDSKWEDYMGLVMTSANTVYFKGDWHSKFNPDDTRTEKFHGLEGDSDAKMMHQKLITSYAENGQASMVTLQFEGYANSMELYLPAAGTDISKLTSVLTSDVCDGLRKASKAYEVTLSLPSFEKDTRTDIVSVLEKMGIISLENTDLTPMGLEKLRMTPIHKTSVKVDETGAELAAVSGGKFDTMGPSTEYPEISIDFDRPFLYLVRNEKTGAILMAGVMTEI